MYPSTQLTCCQEKLSMSLVPTVLIDPDRLSDKDLADVFPKSKTTQ
jgi:hypothetical protein